MELLGIGQPHRPNKRSKVRPTFLREAMPSWSIAALSTAPLDARLTVRAGSPALPWKGKPIAPVD